VISFIKALSNQQSALSQQEIQRVILSGGASAPESKDLYTQFTRPRLSPVQAGFFPCWPRNANQNVRSTQLATSH